MTQSTNFWPDNPYLWFFLVFFLLALGPGLILGALAGVFFVFYFRVRLDRHFIKTREVPLTGKAVILDRQNTRAVQGRRRFGPALVLDDKTSTHEIILYEWMFNRKSLMSLKEEIGKAPL